MANDMPSIAGQSKQSERLVKELNAYLKRGKKAGTRWRGRAKEGVRFYFGDQWDKSDAATIEGRDQMLVTNNCVSRTVRLVLGMMLGRPLDWIAKPVGRNDDDLSEAGTAALKFVADANNDRHLLRQIYFDGLTYGVGIAQVGPRVRVKDPRAEVVQHRRIPPEEGYLDPSSREPDARDAEWFIWRRRVALSKARAMFPATADALNPSKGEEEPGEELTVNEYPTDLTPPPSMWDTFEDWNQFDRESESDQDMVTLCTCWEVRDVPTWLYELADGVPCEFKDPDGQRLPADAQVSKLDAMAMAAAIPGLVRYYQLPVPKVWKHTWAGPLLLESGPDTEHDHDRIPFAFFFYDRDEHGDPVSLVEDMKDLQRAVNSHNAKALYEMGNPATVVTPELLAANGMTAAQFAEHIRTPGAVIVGDAGQIKTLDRNPMSRELFELGMRAEENIQKAAGTNDHLMGYDTAAESGKSKELSMVQGQTAQRDGEESLLTFYRTLGELTLADIQKYHTGPWMVRISDDVGKDKFITLNAPTFDPETGAMRDPVSMDGARFELTIDAQPWTPTLRQRAADTANDMANNEQDPILRMAYRRMAVKSSDWPNRAELLEILSGAEQQSMQAQQQAQAAQMQQQEAAAQADVQREQMRQQGAMGMQQARNDGAMQMQAAKTQAEQEAAALADQRQQVMMQQQMMAQAGLPGGAM